MSRQFRALLVLAGGLLSCIPLHGVAAQGSFRTSLTVTISRLAPEGGSSAPDSLGCRQLTLHWRKLDGAQRYAVYVSTTGGEPWVELPPSNACGPSESAGPTSVSSSEPTAGVPGTRKVYYKVVAVTGGGSSEKTLDSTEVVSVELR